MTRRGTDEPASRLRDRRARLRRGLGAELVACVLLSAKGYRILARRHRTPFGEVDIIAARGRRLAFVEVKRRLTLEAAQAALTPHQAGRIARAADYWLDRNPRFRDHEIGLDAVLIVPSRWPVHIRNGLDAI
ncbi:MAG: YraN family protein [Hyphomicrobiaceae bacterium]